MRVFRSFDKYDEKWYSRLWIARLTEWKAGGKPVVEWGRYLGDDTGGEAEIAAEPGDIIRAGQKCIKKKEWSHSNWYIVQADGKLQHVKGDEARKAWDEKQERQNEPTVDSPVVLDHVPNAALIAEIKRRKIATFYRFCVSGEIPDDDLIREVKRRGLTI
jgi:hypothetical protein